jgi:RimJ/RimL family protein N-acetyltransferase
LDKPLPPTRIELPAELRGERVVLRPHHPDAASELFAAIDESREHLRPWMEWVDEHRSADDTRDYCIRSAARWLLRESLDLGIYYPETGQCLGGIGLHNADWALRSFAIGYWLRASATGHGYATEAVSLLAGLAFTTLAARRVEVTCDATNETSRRVAERSGFVLEGRLRNARLDASGQLGDTLIFSMIPADWQQLKDAKPG